MRYYSILFLLEFWHIAIMTNLKTTVNTIVSNTTSPALSGGTLDCCASGIDLHRKWVRGTL